jgi:hypothetical protein
MLAGLRGTAILAVAVKLIGRRAAVPSVREFDFARIRALSQHSVQSAAIADRVLCQRRAMTESY